MRNTRRHASAIGALAASRLLASSLQAATYLVAARRTPADTLGPILAALGLAAVFVAVADLGMTTRSMRLLAHARDRIYDNGDAIIVKLFGSMIASLLWVAASIAADVSFAPIGFYIFGESLLAYWVGVTIALDSTWRAAVALVASRGLSLCSFLILPGADPMALPQALAFGAIAGAGLLFIRGTVSFRAPMGRISERWRIVVESRHYSIAGVLAQVSNFDTPIVAHFGGPTAAAFYGLPSRLTNSLGLFSQAIAQRILPVSTRADVAAERATIADIRRLIALYGAALTFVFVPAWFVAGPLIGWALGPGYSEAVLPARLVLIASWLANISTPVAALLQGTGNGPVVARILSAAVPLGLSLIGIGAALYGAAGGASGLVVMQLLILLGTWSALQYDLRRKG